MICCVHWSSGTDVNYLHYTRVARGKLTIPRGFVDQTSETITNILVKVNISENLTCTSYASLNVIKFHVYCKSVVKMAYATDGSYNRLIVRHRPGTM